jgi:hypothetical protein
MMFPYQDIVKKVKPVMILFGVSPVIYIVMAFLAVYGKPGLAGNPTMIPLLIVGVLIADAITIGFLIFVQRTPKFRTFKSGYGAAHQVYTVASIGGVLSESLTVYGLLVALLSGLIIYLVGSAIATWICLFWVWENFNENLGKIA